LRILSNSAKFSVGRPLLPAYNFSATVASTYSIYRLGAVASLKFLAIDNMPRITVGYSYSCCVLSTSQCAAGGSHGNPTG